MAYAYLLLSLFFGYSIRKALLQKTDFWLMEQSYYYPETFFFLPVDSIFGLSLSATLLYAVSRIAFILSIDIYHLAFTLFFFALLLGLSILSFLFGQRRAKDKAKAQRIQNKSKVLTIILLSLANVLLLYWAYLLSQKTFFLKNNTLHAGYTVFSDLSPHSALVSSFAKGENLPASYPHFGHSGMRYHFFFYYLAGSLHRFGLPLDYALNLPSILGTWSFGSMLLAIAIKKAKSLLALPILLFLFFFRSSLSGYKILLDAWKLEGNFASAITSLKNSQHYQGPLLRDDWGLYNLNVFANQRHLLWGLSMALIVFLLFWPLVEHSKELSIRSFFQKEKWGSHKNKSFIFYLLLLMLPMPFWHGSASIFLLLVLAFWALFASEKRVFLLAGVATSASALILQKLFQGPYPGQSSPWFSFGYILEEKTPLAIATFLCILFGPAIFFYILVPILTKKKTWKILAISLQIIILFAFTISLTPDITVNHKYFMMTQIFFLPFLAVILSRFISKKKALLAKIPRALLVFVLLILLGFTGFTDTWAYQNQSAFLVRVQTQDPFTKWLEENTEPDSLSLTPPWAMHSYFLSGRQAYYGHSYYASSAGYDTESRYFKSFDFLSGSLDEHAMQIFVQEEGLDFLMIDDGFRNNSEYFIHEKYLGAVFPEIAYFPEQDHLRIYDLRQNP